MITAGTVSWFPQQYAEALFLLKGALGMISVVLLIWHMNRAWCCVKRPAQQMRYLTLLAYAILVAGASVEQVSEGELVSYRHLGSVLVVLLLIITMVVSILDDQHDHPTRKESS